MLILILLIICFLIIAIQDILNREIFWPLLPVVFLISLLYRHNANITSIEIVLNITFLIIILGTTFLVFLVQKQVRLKTFLNEFLGLGDILLFFALTPLFGLTSFIHFLIASLLAIVLGYAVLSFIRKKQGTIPLAGLLSIFTIFYLTSEYLNYPAL